MFRYERFAGRIVEGSRRASVRSLTPDVPTNQAERDKAKAEECS